MPDKIVIVTGGTGHIGKGVCRALTKAGWTVVAVDLQEAPDADYAARVINGDLTDPAFCESVVENVIGEYGGIDALVNMAQKVVIGVPMTELNEEHMLSSFTSGFTVTTAGWERVNLAALPLIALVAIAVGWYGLRHRAPKAA